MIDAVGRQRNTVVTVRVPATTANLGVGFDVLGLALELTATFTFARSCLQVEPSPVMSEAMTPISGQRAARLMSSARRKAALIRNPKTKLSSARPVSRASPADRAMPTTPATAEVQG